MSNPTVQVRSTLGPWENGCRRTLAQLASDTSRNYQTGQMLGRRSDGAVVDYDDTASLEFVGIKLGIHTKVDSTDVNVLNEVEVWQGPFFGMPLSSGSAGLALTGTGAGAIGKLAYAVDSGTVTLDPSAVTYGNVVGRVVGVVSANPETYTGTSVLIAPIHSPRPGGARYITANTTLTAFDLNKTIYVANTGNITIMLPALALASPGDSVINFQKTTSGANTVITLDGNSAETVNGSATNANMTTQWDAITIKAHNGTNWGIVVGKYS